LMLDKITKHTLYIKHLRIQKRNNMNKSLGNKYTQFENIIFISGR
jgi:hypothetical protein